jgi:hypothetical protein
MHSESQVRQLQLTRLIQGGAFLVVLVAVIIYPGYKRLKSAALQSASWVEGAFTEPIPIAKVEKSQETKSSETASARGERSLLYKAGYHLTRGIGEFLGGMEEGASALQREASPQAGDKKGLNVSAKQDSILLTLPNPLEPIHYPPSISGTHSILTRSDDPPPTPTPPISYQSRSPSRAGPTPPPVGVVQWETMTKPFPTPSPTPVPFPAPSLDLKGRQPTKK